MPDPPEEIAENFKRKGNDALKRGPKYVQLQFSRVSLD
jgi:hypothetical protein